MILKRTLLQTLGLAAVLCCVFILQPPLHAAEPRPGGFKYFVGIVGNPSVPDISSSDEELAQQVSVLNGA